MQIAARDVGRLSRLIAGSAGIAVAAVGVPLTIRGVPPAAAFIPAGIALCLAVLPGRRARLPGRRARGVARFLAIGAAVIAAAALGAHPAAAVASVFAGLAIACLDMRVLRRDSSATSYRVADPLLAGSATIALVALVPQLFDPALAGDVMSPYDAGALLTLGIGAVLARPSQATGTTGTGAVIRRALPVLVAVPVVAALVSALATRTGISRPAAAISTGAILAALAVLALLTYLVRTLDGADRRQRNLVDELHDRQEFAETLLQSMNEAVMVLDANHRVIDVNRRWRELTGHDESEPVRYDTPPLPPGHGGDWLMPRVDGTTVPVLATLAAIPDAQGRPRGYVATYADIADRKRAEEELSSHAAELADGNERLREANARLEAALAFKNDLTSMLTHDVAQPISSIASLAELLRADWDDLPDDIRLELATKIDKNTQRLIKMMNDLQLLFRLDMGSITARQAPVPLREAITTVVASADIEIDIPDELSVLVDRGHLVAVVQNLVANAVAYGDPPVRICAERGGDVVTLTVEDGGPGIPRDLVPHLFGRFMRGSGLGLFIVRHLVEANGGSVRYEPVDPHGTRMLVTLESAAV